MTSLYVWKANGATVCRFHRTPSDWDYQPLSAIDPGARADAPN